MDEYKPPETQEEMKKHFHDFLRGAIIIVIILVAGIMFYLKYRS